MNVIRDILDHQILDCNQKKMGRVDGIVIELRDGQPPRLAYIEVGMPTLASRIHPQLESWVSAFQSKWGAKLGNSFRIPWSQIQDLNIGGTDINVDLEAESTPAFAWEIWLREHVIKRIPGSG